MRFMVESSSLKDYLEETKEINFSHPNIIEKAEQLFAPEQSDIEKVRIAFEFVRDEISHSWDIQSRTVTACASEALCKKEGICYVKSMVLAALLRLENIPTGFCYQRLMLFDTPDKGYCIHALNAVFIPSINKWIRLDARGNKEGIDAQFSLDEAKLAFSVNEKLGEIDYPHIFVNPNSKTVSVLNEYNDLIDLYKGHLPQFI